MTVRGRFVKYQKGVSVEAMGECKGIWEGVIAFRRCDSPQGGV